MASGVAMVIRLGHGIRMGGRGRRVFPRIAMADACPGYPRSGGCTASAAAPPTGGGWPGHALPRAQICGMIEKVVSFQATGVPAWLQGREINPLIAHLLCRRGQNILERCARGRDTPGHDGERERADPSPANAYPD